MENKLFNNSSDDKKIRVPGGLQTPSVRKKMIQLFDKMKENGLFQKYKDYFQWERANFTEDIEDDRQEYKKPWKPDDPAEQKQFEQVFGKKSYLEE